MKKIVLFVTLLVTMLMLLAACGECEHAEWSNWTVTTESTCTAEGVETRECVECGEKETRALALKAHSYGAWTTTEAATCTSEGTEEQKCSCGDTKTRSISKTSHSYGSWTTVTAATCTSEGTEEQKCSCGDTKTRAISKTSHSYGSWITVKAATCTTSGTKESKCSGCGDTKTETISATGHSYGSFKIVKAATCTAEGKEERKCKNCDEAESKSIPKLAHIYNNGVVTKAATCTTDGVKTYSCKNCNYSYTQSIQGGHKWTNATCIDPKTCSVCSDTQGLALGHSVDNGICTRCKKDFRVTLYEGKYAKIVLNRVEKYQYRENAVEVYFDVTNKYSKNLLIQADAIAFNGFCYADITMSDDVKVGATTTVKATVYDVDFDLVNIYDLKSVGGQLRIIDDDSWDSLEDAVFTNVKLDGSGSDNAPTNFGKKLLYSSKYCNIFYGYSEVNKSNADRIDTYLYIENKRTKTLLIQADAIAYNGVTSSNNTMSDNVLPKTIGKVSVSVYNVFSDLIGNGGIKSIGGQLRIIDDASWDDLEDAVFTNIVVDGSGTHAPSVDLSDKACFYKSGNCSIYYYKVEKPSYGDNKLTVYLLVENKCGFPLLIQGNSLTINGTLFDDIIVSDEVITDTVGVVEITVYDYDYSKIPISSINTIGGNIKIIDDESWNRLEDAIFDGKKLDGSTSPTDANNPNHNPGSSGSGGEDSSNNKWQYVDALNFNNYATYATSAMNNAVSYMTDAIGSSSSYAVLYINYAISYVKNAQSYLNSMRNLANSRVGLELTGSGYSTLAEKTQAAYDMCGQVTGLSINTSNYSQYESMIRDIAWNIYNECLGLQSLSVSLLGAFS